MFFQYLLRLYYSFLYYSEVFKLNLWDKLNRLVIYVNLKVVLDIREEEANLNALQFLSHRD